MTAKETLSDKYLWILINASTWSLLYLGFHQGMEGAIYTLKFYIWFSFTIIWFGFSEDAVVRSAKRKGNNFAYHVYMATHIIALSLLVWFGHIVTAVALLISIIASTVLADAVKKKRIELAEKTLDT